ncbi:MAG: IS701 family transposase [Planctomycetes bacterium]|nr:IS701 family transposase [Planctomycetota bacterium]
MRKRTAAHFDNYCRGLLSDLPRKSVEPIALACGTAVRALQEFLTTADWQHEDARATLQRRVAQVLDARPDDELGTAGVIDETSCQKKGDRTPGVRRQYLGCVGQIDNGIVTVHVGVAKGTFQALLDADLFLPECGGADRTRCQEAGVPDGVRYRPKWQIAFEQLVRLDGSGVRFDWLVFDEGYGSKVPFLRVLDAVGRRFVGEVPVGFAVATALGGQSQRADGVLGAGDATRGPVFQLPRKTVGDSRGRAAGRAVEVQGCRWLLVVAINEATAEVKDFTTNAVEEPSSRILAAAFRRATIEHEFRVTKSAVGLMHYEGRPYAGLVRHLVLGLAARGFVSIHTDRLRGEEPQVTMERVCRALNVRCAATFRRRRGTSEVPHVGQVIRYHQRRNERATKSHKKPRHRCVT